MHLALLIVAALAAEPTTPAYSFEIASPIIWLSVSDRPNPAEWEGFFKIRRDGQPPTDGVFQVDGRPVQPEVEWVSSRPRRKNGPPVKVGENRNGNFDLRVQEPGRYTFKASIGKEWSCRMTVEVATLPFKTGMKKPDFLEKFGNPDFTLPSGEWVYKQWANVVLLGDPVQVRRTPADAWQQSILDASARLVDEKDLKVLVGTWEVTATNNYSGKWAFLSDGTVIAGEGAGRGTWTFEPKRVKVTWDANAWESFSRPLNPDGVVGDSWHGEGILRAKKISDGHP